MPGVRLGVRRNLKNNRILKSVVAMLCRVLSRVETTLTQGDAEDPLSQGDVKDPLTQDNVKEVLNIGEC